MYYLCLIWFKKMIVVLFEKVYLSRFENIFIFNFYLDFFLLFDQKCFFYYLKSVIGKRFEDYLISYKIIDNYKLFSSKG